jgi:hypothetical protein
MDFHPLGFDGREQGELQELDAGFLERAKVGWFTKLLLSIAIPWGMGRLARELGGHGIELSKKADAFFGKTERVDVVPSRDGSRGFQLVIDQALSLYFCQDGDHFVYDGFEMGAYEAGEVTIFDEA